MAKEEELMYLFLSPPEALALRQFEIESNRYRPDHLKGKPLDLRWIDDAQQDFRKCLVCMGFTETNFYEALAVIMAQQEFFEYDVWAWRHKKIVQESLKLKALRETPVWEEDECLKMTIQG